MASKMLVKSTMVQVMNVLMPVQYQAITWTIKYCQFNPQEQFSITIESKQYDLHSIKCI